MSTKQPTDVELRTPRAILPHVLARLCGEIMYVWSVLYISAAPSLLKKLTIPRKDYKKKTLQKLYVMNPVGLERVNHGFNALSHLAS